MDNKKDTIPQKQTTDVSQTQQTLFDENTDDTNRISNKATATGWGTTEFGGKATDNLLAVSVKVVALAKCKQIYGNNLHEWFRYSECHIRLVPRLLHR